MGETITAAGTVSTSTLTSTTKTSTIKTSTTTTTINPKYYCKTDVDCDTNARCINYNCFCNSGFFGSGKKCCRKYI